MNSKQHDEHDEKEVQEKQQKEMSKSAQALLTYNLPQEFLQRTPGPKTIRDITSRNVQTCPADFGKEFKKKKLEFELGKDEDEISNANEETILHPENIAESDVGLGSEPNEKEVQHYDEVDLSLPVIIKSDALEEKVGNSNPDKPIKNVDAKLNQSSADDNYFNLESVDHVCIECVKPLQVTCRDDVQRGDHITFSGKIYDHHAIVVRVYDLDDSSPDTLCVQIVHATNTSAKATLASLHPFGNKARLRKVEELLNIRERKVFVYKYSSSMNVFTSKEIVDRALAEAEADMAGGKGKFVYNLFRNNCEHFATWCVTGRKLSLQERKFTMVFWMFLTSGFRGVSDENKRNDKEYEYKMLCQACYERNKKILNVPKKKILDAADVKKGDIITFSYWYLWHDAVVLDVIEQKVDCVTCNIAHYAFRYFDHRTIKKEIFSFPLDGSVTVTQYPKDFNLYTPDQVVARARERLGEQEFAFFSNDSSQYSRWCKLKLTKRTENDATV